MWDLSDSLCKLSWNGAANNSNQFQFTLFVNGPVMRTVFFPVLISSKLRSKTDAEQMFSLF